MIELQVGNRLGTAFTCHVVVTDSYFESAEVHKPQYAQGAISPNFNTEDFEGGKRKIVRAIWLVLDCQESSSRSQPPLVQQEPTKLARSDHFRVRLRYSSHLAQRACVEAAW